MTRARDVANLIGSGNYSSTTFTATAGQTAFSISHTQGFVQVFMNGLLLDETVDYTSNGSAITLTSGAAAGDEIEVVKYNTFSVGDAIPASGGTFSGNVTVGGTLGVTGASTMSGDVAINGTLTSTSTGTTLSSNSYNVVKIQTDKDDNGSNDDGVLQFTTGSSNTVKGEIRYDESESMFEIGHGDNQGHIRIDSSGRVTKPNQPCFSAGGNFGWQDVGSSYGKTNPWRTNQTGQFNSGMFEANTGRATAPVAGRYQFNLNIYTNNSGEYYHYGRLYLNGTQFADTILHLGDTSNDYPDETMSGSFIVNMAANDYVEYYHVEDIYGYHSSFSGFLIG